MVTTQFSASPPPVCLVAFDRLVGPLKLAGLSPQFIMLRDGEGRSAMYHLDDFADDYSVADYQLLARLSTVDAFRIGMEWAWQRQNFTIRDVVPLAA
jgi:hypothetical protein